MTGNNVFTINYLNTFPQRLKPLDFCADDGGAEAPPLQRLIDKDCLKEDR